MPAPRDVQADPIGVIVDLIAAIESAMDRTAIEEAAIAVAGGRAKRRRLAQALVDNPGVLAHGRSPASRGVGELLIALRNAGATRVSPPRCTECRKPLRTLQRRGEDWFCSPCAAPQRRQRCAGCGEEKTKASRDRRGQPRCKQCPDHDNRDPLVVLTAVVGKLEPALPPAVVSTAASRVFVRPTPLRRLAWTIEDDPGLLTGDGARAPTQGILRLIEELVDGGAITVRRPRCPGCDRVVRLHRRINGRWHCRNCVAKSRAQPCARCGVLREAAARDEQGRPLCPNCLITDPCNQEICVDCGRRRPVSARTPTGPLCGSCRPWKTLTCAICGRIAPCVVSKTTGEPWCKACKQRWIRCARCDEVAPLRGGSLDHPLCSACTCPDADWHSCPACGQPGRIHEGRCARCTVQQRLHELLSTDGGIQPELQPLYQALAATERPATVAAWLDRSAAPTILRSLSGQGITHEALDELPDGKTLDHLRSILVAVGILPTRDEHMARLERWITRTIADRADAEEQHLLRRYAVWHLLRRLRQRTHGAEATHSQYVVVRQHVRAAIHFLDWLAAHDLTLATARQGDLDSWLANKTTTSHREVGHFLRWAKKEKLARLEAPADRWGGPSRVLDTETRWEQARWLLHDNAVKPEDRLAGLLVLLYAQWPAAISRLTLDHVDISGTEVRIRLGDEPVTLPEPLDTLARQVVARRRGKAALGAPPTSPWLFPGGQPGRPISAFGLGERLRQLGLHPGQARSTALFQLATELPAAVLARMLGIHITVAVAWQRASAGDWTGYAAEVSRRTNQGIAMSHHDEQPAHDSAVISPERAAEIEHVIHRITRWAADRDDIVGLLLVGSCARNAARPDSDIDLVLLTRDTTRYPDSAWADELAIGELIRTRSWGPITEQRFATPSGLEVEIDIGCPDWASVNPIDPGTRRVVTDGARILHDPTRILATLLRACQNQN
jgi:hypothetical protein